MKKTIITWGVIISVAVAAAVILVRRYTHSPEDERLTVKEAKIVSLKPVAELLTMELHEEIPVRGRIGSKHIFARMTVEGRVMFDLDTVKPEYRGDTLIVRLPRERVEIMESTDKDAYQVIDTWNDRPLRSSYISARQENDLKRMALDHAARRMYERGYVKRARKNARESLAHLLTLSWPGTVLVIDECPK